VSGCRDNIFKTLAALLCCVLIPASIASTEDDASLQVDALRSAIEVLEKGGDSWHPEIAEVILSLAGHFQATGDHEEALALLERAVHLSRINHGLFSLQQVPGLRMQVDSHLAMNQWDEADGLNNIRFSCKTDPWEGTARR
jgi:tetratricopeptide (TPR) repeat protein